jgi:SPP1 family phage portal protein
LHIKKIKRLIDNDLKRRDIILEAKRYYENDNDIKRKGVVPKKEGGEKDPLRNADNRIPHNHHEIIVDEKISYLFTYPVLFDIDDDKDKNNKLTGVLGEDFRRKIKNVATEASNCGTAWLHYWIKDKEFKYEMVETEQMIPTYSNTLERELTAVIRYYTVLEEQDAGAGEDKAILIVQYWTNKDMLEYKFQDNTTAGEPTPVKIIHKLGEVPFIEFANNAKKSSDLSRYKPQLDLYDRVMSGFANDLEDIQQIIYILENYGGQDLGEFLGDLKRYKTVKTESDVNGGSSGGLKTLQIEIPVEARKVILEILKKQIYESGQALQQDVEGVGNASGVALKFFYRKLELKSGLMETEFRSGLNKLAKAVLKFLNMDAKKIQQTYTRNMISNDLENAQIAQISVGIIPEKFIWNNHPWVDDVEEAERLMQEERKDEYKDLFSDNSNAGEIDE